MNDIIFVSQRGTKDLVRYDDICMIQKTLKQILTVETDSEEFSLVFKDVCRTKCILTFMPKIRCFLLSIIKQRDTLDRERPTAAL